MNGRAGYKKRFIFVLQMFFLLLLLARATQHILNEAANMSKSIDFQYDSAKLFSQRVDIYSMCVEGKPEMVHDYDMYYGKLEPNQFPSILCFLVPWTIFDPIVANRVWFFSNIVFTVLIGIFLKKTFLRTVSLYETAIYYLLMVCCVPYEGCLGLGQHTLFAMAFYFMALYFSEKESSNGWAGIAGLCLSISWFKYTLTAPLTLYLIYKKKWKTIGIALAIQVVLTLWSAWWLDCPIWKCIAYPLQISSWLSTEGFVDLRTFVKNDIVYYFAVSLLILCACAIAWFSRRYAFRKDDYLDVSIFTFLLIVSYAVVYHRHYDFVFFFIVCFFFIENLRKNKRVYVHVLVDIAGLTMCYVFLFTDTIIKRVGIVLVEGTNIEKLQNVCTPFLYILLIYLWGNCCLQLKRYRQEERTDRIKKGREREI